MMSGMNRGIGGDCFFADSSKFFFPIRRFVPIFLTLLLGRPKIENEFQASKPLFPWLCTLFDPELFIYTQSIRKTLLMEQNCHYFRLVWFSDR